MCFQELSQAVRSVTVIERFAAGQVTALDSGTMGPPSAETCGENHSDENYLAVGPEKCPTNLLHCTIQPLLRSAKWLEPVFPSDPFCLRSLCVLNTAKEGLRGKAPCFLLLFTYSVHHWHAAAPCCSAAHLCCSASLIFGSFYDFSFYNGFCSIKWRACLGTEDRSFHFALEFWHSKEGSSTLVWYFSSSTLEPLRQELSDSIHMSRGHLLFRMLWGELLGIHGYGFDN